MAPPTATLDASTFLRTTLGEAPFAVGRAFRRLACSPDGSLVAGAGGRVVWVARASDGVVLHRLRGLSSHIYAVCFARDGATLFAVGDYDTVAWNVSDGTPRFILERALLSPLATLSLDGASLIIDTNSELVSIDAATGAMRATAQRPYPRVFSAPVFSGDGRVVSVGNSGLVLYGDDLQVIAEIDPDRGFSHMCPVGATNVVAAVSNRTLFLYDLDGRCAIARAHLGLDVHDLFAQGDAVWVLHSTPMPEVAWRLTPYDATTLQALPERAVTTLPTNAAIGHDGDTLWVASDGTLLRQPLAEGGDLRERFFGRDACVALRFDAKSERLSACVGNASSSRGSAARWDLSTGRSIVREFARHVTQSLTPEGDAVYVYKIVGGESRRHAFDGSAEGELFDAAAEHDTAHAPGPSGRSVAVDARALRVLPDGARWPLPAKHRLQSQPEWHVEEELVTALDGSRVRAFDLREGACLEPLKVPLPRAHCSAPGGAWIVTNIAAQRWDVRTRAKLREVKFELAQWDLPTAIAASRDERLLAVGTAHGALLVVELDGAGRAVMFQTGGEGCVRACAFSHDGALLATGSDDPRVFVWDVARALDAAPPKASKKRR